MRNRRPSGPLSTGLLKIDLDPIETSRPWIGPAKRSDVYRYFELVSFVDHPANGAIRVFGNRHRAVCLSRDSQGLYVLCIPTSDHGYSPDGATDKIVARARRLNQCDRHPAREP